MIERDTVETIALVALFIISSGLCALVGYALGRMRGEDPTEASAKSLITYRTPEGEWEVIAERPEPGSWATSTLWLCPSCTKCSAPMVQGIDAYWCRSCEHEEPYEQAAPTVVDARERR